MLAAALALTATVASSVKYGSEEGQVPGHMPSFPSVAAYVKASAVSSARGRYTTLRRGSETAVPRESITVAGSAGYWSSMPWAGRDVITWLKGSPSSSNADTSWMTTSLSSTVATDWPAPVRAGMSLTGRTSSTTYAGSDDW